MLSTVAVTSRRGRRDYSSDRRTRQRTSSPSSIRRDGTTGGTSSTSSFTSANPSGTNSMTNKVEIKKRELSFLGSIARRQTADLSKTLQRISKLEEEIQTLQRIQREEHEQRTAKAHPEPVVGVEHDAP